MKANVFLAVVGLSATNVFASRLRVAMTAEVRATSWLRGHPAPQADELAELKDTNPEAYGLVKALLMKRSLGLLDPHHPTASFANAGPKAADDGAPHGAAAYEALATPQDKEIEARSATTADEPEAVAVPQHHITDMFAWRPSASADNDDAEVQNVLGAVANLKQSSPAASAPQGGSSGSSLDADSSILDGEAAAPAAPAAPVAAAAPVAPAAPTEPLASPVENPAPQRQANEENHYLKGLDLTGGPSKGADLNADMNMFEDTASANVAAPPQSTAAPVAAAPVKSDPLSSWLGIKKVVQTQSKAPSKPAAPAAPSNPYLVDWNN